MIFEKFPHFISLLSDFLFILSLLKLGNGLCISGKQISCLTELSDEETNRTVEYVLNKYEQIHMKIMGQLEAVYGLRLTHGHKPNSESEEDVQIAQGDGETNENVTIVVDEEEVNIHFKYVDNTPHDIIQNCVFVIHSNKWDECKKIETICNTFLPITPRPLMQRDTLRVCNDNDVQLDIQNEEIDSTTLMDITHNENDNDDADADNDDDDDGSNGDSNMYDEMVTKPFKTIDNMTMIEIGHGIETV